MSSTAQRLLTGARVRRDRGEAITATDGELLMRFRRSGDRQALTQILDRHAAMVWGVCRNVLHREQDAQDAFQATFLILLRRADSIRANDSAAGWLYRVALRAACDVRRTRLRRREEPLDAEPPQPEPAFPDIQRRQLAAALMEELQALPDKYQVPLVLRYLEGLSRREIAEQLDTTVAGVQGCLVRGKRQLRSRLVRRGVSLSVAMGVITGGRPAEAAPVGSVLSSGGAASAFSPVVQQLTASGVRSMIFAAYAKPVAVAATVAIAALLATTDAAPPRAASTRESADVLTLDTTPTDSDEAGASAIAITASGVAPSVRPAAKPIDLEPLVEGLVKDPFGPRLTREEAGWLVGTGFGDPADPRRQLIDMLEAAAPGKDFLSLFASAKHRAEESLAKRFDLVAAELGERSAKADEEIAVGNAIELPREVEVEHVQLDLADAKPDPARAEPQQELVDAYRRLVEMIRMRHEQGTINATPLAAAESRYASALAELHLLRGEREEAVRQLQAAVDEAQKRSRFLQMAMEEGTQASVDEMFDAAEQLARAKQALVAAQQGAGAKNIPGERGADSSDAISGRHAQALRMQAEAMQAQAKAVELQRKMATMQKHAEQLHKAAAELAVSTPESAQSYNLTTPVPPTPPTAALSPSRPAPPVPPTPASAPVPYLPAPSPAAPRQTTEHETVEPGDRIVISRSHTVFEERESPEGERQRVPREVHEQLMAVTDKEGNLNLPGLDKAIPLEGRTVAEATQLLQEHDPRFKSVEKFRQRKLDSGLAGPLVSASPAVDDQFDAMRRRLEEQGRLIEELQQKLRASDGSHYGPESTMKQGSWNAQHEPSAIDPMGWAVVAELRPGEHMPVLFPGDSRPRPHLMLDHFASSELLVAKLVDPRHASDGVTVSVGGKGGVDLRVRGEMFQLHLLDYAEESDSALLLLRCVQGRTESELRQSLPTVAEAKEVLHSGSLRTASDTTRDEARVKESDALYLSGYIDDGEKPVQIMGGIHSVTDAGEIELGPQFGKVAVAGLSLEQAEAALQEAISRQLPTALVRVTYADAVHTDDRSPADKTENLRVDLLRRQVRWQAEQVRSLTSLREQLDQQRMELQRQAEMLKEQRKNEQGRGAGAENPAPAAGDESDNS